MLIDYPAVLTIDDHGVAVEFPDLPGCLTCADSVEEAINRAREALELHISGMIKDGDNLPKPSNWTLWSLPESQICVVIEALVKVVR